MGTYGSNTNYDNERKYLNNLIAGGGGNAEWAKQQMKELESAAAVYEKPAATTPSYTPSYTQTTTPKTSSKTFREDTVTIDPEPSYTRYTDPTPTSGNSSGGTSPYNANTNWDNETRYLQGLIEQGGGNGQWAQKQMQTLNQAKEQYRPQATSQQPVSTAATSPYNANTNWANERAYLANLYNTGNAATRKWADDQIRVLYEAEQKYNPVVADKSWLDPSSYSAGSNQKADAAAGLYRDPETGLVYSPTGRNMTGYNFTDWTTNQSDYVRGVMGAMSSEELSSLLSRYELQAAAQGWDISGSDPNHPSRQQLADKWYTERGYAIPNQFRSWDGTWNYGYYGEDENGDHGYFADPERTQKLSNGNWGKNPNNGHDMSRHPELAGMTVFQNGYNITYDDLGYAVSATNMNHPLNSGKQRGISMDAALGLSTGGTSRDQYGGSDYDKMFLTNYELGQIDEWRREAEQGKITWQQANEYAESIRAKYGYSGGSDGSGYISDNPLPTMRQGTPTTGGDSYSGISSRVTSPSIGGGDYGGYPSGGYPTSGYTGYTPSDGRPSYYDPYADAISRLTQEILSRDPFSYDRNKDPLYGYYSDAYERNGQRAMKDTLGQMAARTGGMASSWAGSQAQQSYNDYMANLNDVVPELYQLAYSMWQDDEDYTRKNLDLLQNLQQGDYSKYLDALSQWNTDRNFNYGAYRDSVSDQRYADDVAYQRYRDAILDQRYADETAYSRAQYGDETAYSRLMSLAQLGGQYGDFGYLNQLGINPNLQAAAISGSTGTRSGGSSGSGSRSSSGGSSSGSAGGDAGKWADVEAYVAIGGDADDYINANYKSLGYSSQSAARSAWKVYQTQSAASSASVPSNSTPYNATTNPLTSVYYDEDEGIFTWNGKNYSSAEAFSTDLNKYVSRGIVTPAIEAEIKKKLALFGFDA